MNDNPLADITEKIKQHKIESELAEIKQSLNLFMGEQKHMAHFIKVTSSDGVVVAVNPAYVVCVFDGSDAGGCIKYSDGGILDTIETKEQLIALFNGESGKTTIG